MDISYKNQSGLKDDFIDMAFFYASSSLDFSKLKVPIKLFFSSVAEPNHYGWHAAIENDATGATDYYEVYVFVRHPSEFPIPYKLPASYSEPLSDPSRPVWGRDGHLLFLHPAELALFICAHELRHVWQTVTSPDKQYREKDDKLIGYHDFEQEGEDDADNYAISVVNKYWNENLEKVDFFVQGRRSIDLDTIRIEECPTR